MDGWRTIRAMLLSDFWLVRFSGLSFVNLGIPFGSFSSTEGHNFVFSWLVSRPLFVSMLVRKSEHLGLLQPGFHIEDLAKIELFGEVGLPMIWGLIVICFSHVSGLVLQIYGSLEAGLQIDGFAADAEVHGFGRLTTSWLAGCCLAAGWLNGWLTFEVFEVSLSFLKFF